MLAAAAALLVACGADVGEATSRLAVNEDLMTNEVLYVLPDVSQVPFTARELETLGFAPAEAIPVRVEIFEDIAVAWFAPDGEARIGRDWIVALWRVQRASAQELARGELPSGAAAVSDDTFSDAPPAVNAPAYHDDAATLGPGATYEIEARPELRGGAEVGGAEVGGAEVTLIEFWDRLGTPDELTMLEELYQHHPGC